MRTLAVSGQLDLTMGGPSVKIESPPFANRRTVYSFIDRQNLPGLFRTFDFASPDTHSPKRYSTTVPQQGLFLLNSPFLMQQARISPSGRGLRMRKKTPRPASSSLYHLCLARDPSAEELALAREFLRSALPDEVKETDSSPWAYGYGPFDEKTQRVTEFHPLPHWTGSAWQGGPKLPDPNLGWATLNADGGHPARKFAVVRRWTAPEAGTLHIRGFLKHPDKQGNGVRAHDFSQWSGTHQDLDRSQLANANPVRYRCRESRRHLRFHRRLPR